MIKVNSKKQDIVKVLNEENKELFKQNKVKRSKKFLSWPLKVLLFTFCISLTFGIVSELVTTHFGVVISLLVIVVFLIINIFADIIGVAFTVCLPESFVKLEEKNISGINIGKKLLKNAEKVSSFFCDVVGDICGILSGSAGGAIFAKFGMIGNSSEQILIATIISSLIASLTIFGKAIGKNFAINNSVSIVLKVSFMLNLFNIKRKKKKNVKHKAK